MDLKDIVQVCFGTRPVLENFILVACYFESLFPLRKKSGESLVRCST